MEKCEAMIQKALQQPKVKFLRQSLEKAGCPVGDNFFKAVHCYKRMAGGYVPGRGIIVCGNHLRIQDEVTQVITHELIHAFDHCRAATIDFSNCAHQACTEIRANHLSGDCHYMRELLRGFRNLRGHEPECVKRRVLTSLSAKPQCSGSIAEDSMEAAWDICYYDTLPFDKAP